MRRRTVVSMISLSRVGISVDLFQVPPLIIPAYVSGFASRLYEFHGRDLIQTGDIAHCKTEGRLVEVEILFCRLV